MNPGLLKHSILIQRQAPGLFLTDAAGNYLTDAAHNRLTTDSRKGRFGAEVDAWGLYVKRRASRKDLSSGSDEATNNGREIGRQRLRFRMRYVHNLQVTDRLIADGHAHDIVAIVELERRAWHEVICVLHANTRAEGQNAE